MGVLKTMGGVCVVFAGLVWASAWAWGDDRPLVRDTVAGILERVGRTIPASQLRTLTVGKALTLLTPHERDVLAAHHLSFRVNVPALVTILADAKLTNEPFWLNDRGFRRTDLSVTNGSRAYEAWERQFPAGEIGLGVNSLGGGAEHYLVLIRPLAGAPALEITELRPEGLKLAGFVPGVAPYADREETMAQVPSELSGRTLLRTLRASRDDGRLIQVFRWTSHPSSRRPDHVVLTWSADPRTTQAVQWRTSTAVTRGYVTWALRSKFDPARPTPAWRVAARTEALRDPRLLNDPVVHRHTAVLTGLQPGSTYVYRVGDGTRRGWSEWTEFRTAPAGGEPFTFVYLGDAQVGFDTWGALLRRAFQERPAAAFFLMAGDMVNRGNERDDWDSLFHNARGVYDRRPLVPVIGNHECQGGHPTFFLRQFALPANGPAGCEAERSYAFQYGSALVLVLDSNLEPSAQVGWLEAQLSRTAARWKLVAFHHPVYSSAPGRENRKIQEQWLPLFDRHHVDLVLQGHDHAYLRTYPMKGGLRVGSPSDGTSYVVSFSGSKMYEQASHSYTQVGFAKIPTWQTLDIQVGPDRLVYRAQDAHGTMRDEWVIEK